MKSVIDKLFSSGRAPTANELNAIAEEIKRSMAMPAYIVQNDPAVQQAGVALTSGIGGGGVGQQYGSPSLVNQANRPSKMMDLPMPDGCFELDQSSFRSKLSACGMLYLRLHWRSMHETQMGQALQSYPVGKFAIPGVAIVDCVPIRKEDKMNVVCWIENSDSMVTIEDDLGLFPSDALITKLRTLESK